jgi:NitT/TauT family transport system permease protein
VENDRGRIVYVGSKILRNDAERPHERVSGEQSTFTFDSLVGIISLDGVVQSEGRDFTRDGQIISFLTPPPRNAKLRQNPDYLLTNASAGELLLTETPEPDAIVWTNRYSYYHKPGCGQTLLECFYALPQHPVPYPHWIAKRFKPFVSKFPLSDERNVVRSTAYTTLGTLGALALGGAVGILLAILFVLFRPLEQALFPWVIASQTVPIIALVPVLLLILGNFGITIQTSLLPTAIIGAYIAFFPVVVGTVKGLRSVEPLALDLMKTYAASPLQVFLKVRFPAAVPFFFTSLKLGTAASLVGALVAETESNNRRGLGFQILGQVQSGNVADVWILLIISGLLGVGLVAFIGLIERLFTPWKRT